MWLNILAVTAIGAPVIVWAGRTVRRSGRPALDDLLGDRALSIVSTTVLTNTILLLGFGVLGLVAGAPVGATAPLVAVPVKIGVVLLGTGATLLVVLGGLRRRRRHRVVEETFSPFERGRRPAPPAARSVVAEPARRSPSASGRGRTS